MALDVKTAERKLKNKTVNNTGSDKIVITRDKLYYKLSKHYGKLGHRYDWVGATALTITLIITLLTSNFKPILGIDSNTLKGFFIMFTICSVIYTIHTITLAVKSRKHNINDVINDIFEEE